MKVLVTGNNGYVGTVLTDILLKKGYSVTGLDVNYFEPCTFEHVKHDFSQIVKDIRSVERKDVTGFDAIIHLAGLSNDPLGELNPGLTEEINFHGTVNIARGLSIWPGLPKKQVSNGLYMLRPRACMVFQTRKMSSMRMTAKKTR